MDRRENLKLLIAGGLGTGLLFTAACKPEKPNSVNGQNTSTDHKYGRIPEETERDKKLMEQPGFTPGEMAVITAISEIIIPVDKDCIGATAAGVPEFIDFIAKDIPSHKLPIQGGLMWVESESNRRFQKTFAACTHEQHIQIIDDIAYPDTAKPEFSQGVKFFNLMRDLTMTGYFTSKDGLKDLGYLGNVPNEWDGVPEEVLAKFNLSYDDKWKDQYIKMENRNKVAKWDDKGNVVG
jgi:gluconate 2-dehydrogenase gamma chain